MVGVHSSRLSRDNTILVRTSLNDQHSVVVEIFGSTDHKSKANDAYGIPLLAPWRYGMEQFATRVLMVLPT